MSESEALLSAIERTVAVMAEPFDSVAVAYSGGLDSSVIAAIARRTVRVRCYCACVPSSFDALHAEELASQDRFDIKILELADQDLVELARLARRLFPQADPVTVSYAIPCLCVLERAPEGGLFVGNVADEVFGGYAKYESIPDPANQALIDLEKAMFEVEILSNYARKRHKALLAPYADEDIVNLASRIPFDRESDPGRRKLVLRECARMLGLGASERPKKAAQYSSGTAKRIKQLAKKDGKTLSEWIRDA